MRPTLVRLVDKWRMTMPAQGTNNIARSLYESNMIDYKDRVIFEHT